MIYAQKLNRDNQPIIEWGKTTTLFVSLGLAFFVASLFMVSLFTSGENIHGYWALLIGWLGLIIFQFAWFANPLNLLALLYLHEHPNVSLLLSVLAFILATQTFYFSEIPISINAEKIYIKELGLGFYIWYIAQFLFFIASLTEVFKKRIISKSPDTSLSS